MSLSGATAHLAWGVILAQGYTWTHVENQEMSDLEGFYDTVDYLQKRLARGDLADRLEIEVWEVAGWDTEASDVVLFLKETHEEADDCAVYLSENRASHGSSWPSDIHKALDDLGLTVKDDDRHKHGWLLGFSAYLWTDPG